MQWVDVLAVAEKRSCVVCCVGPHEISDVPTRGDSAPFHLHGDKVYCWLHFESLFESKCCVCTQKITSRYIKVRIECVCWCSC